MMRHLLVTVLACLFLIAPIGCGSTVSVERSPDGDHRQDQYPAHVKRPGPPAHAPAHGYRRKFQYHYYPDAKAYYAPDRGTYFWFEAGQWRVGVELPNDIRVNLGDHVTIDLDADSPYEHYQRQVEIHRGKNHKRKH